MRVRFEIGPVAIQFWKDEIPPEIMIDADSMLQYAIETHCPSSSPLFPSVNCLEIYRSYGPKIVYMMLAALFEPSHTTELTIDVAFIQGKRLRPTWTIAPRFADVWLGIPEWAPDEINSGVRDLTTILQPPAGHLEFRFGAYAMLGASPIAYCKLAKCLAFSLFYNEEECPPQQLTKLVLDEFG